MAEQDANRGFEIRDRRRQPDEAPSSSVEHRTQAAGEAAPGPGRPESPEPAHRSLVGLFMMLAGFAMAALEGVQDPATGHLVRDPQQAAELIDTLMLLREKTEGHRTAEESQALDELIYDLHLRYVNATTSSR